MGIQEYYHFIQSLSKTTHRSVIASLFEPEQCGIYSYISVTDMNEGFGFQLFILHFLLPTLIVKLGA